MSEPTGDGILSADEQLLILVQQLRSAEMNLQAFAADQVDAVISPASETPILLRHAREALAESEIRYRRLISRMSAVLFELLPDGTISFVNDAAACITGFPKEEMIGQNWWSLCFPGERSAETGELRNHLEVEDVIGFQVGLTGRSGGRITLELTTANRYDGSGRLRRIIGLGIDVTARNHAQEEVRRLDEQLLNQQRLLTHRFMTTLEEERRAISFELHDGLTQYVMSSFAFLDSYATVMGDTTNTPMPAELRLGMKCLHEAVVEARRLVNGLRALALDELGLVRSLEQLLLEEQERAGWQEAELIQEALIPRFDTVLETAAYRVAQEALTNIRKHAEATRVQVAFALEPEPDSEGSWLVVEVRDWGKGFTLTEKCRHYDHVGLQSMEERVNLLKGSFRIESSPGKGTRVCARFPVDAEIEA
jgi:PAS domain S-box-containing protein